MTSLGRPRRERSDRAAGMPRQRMVDLVHGFARRRVAVLGDLVADEFVHGDIERISREAPVPILLHRRTVTLPGGGGNAIANLRALGAVPLPVGVVGRDDPGRALVASFRSAGIHCPGIHVDPSYETPSKSRILAGGVHTRRQQIVRVDRGRRAGDLGRAAAVAVGRALRQALDRAEGLLVADYGYGAATPELVARARPRGTPLLVDSRARVALYRGASGCTPNQEELELALGLGPLEDDPALELAGQALLRRTANGAVLVTRGSRGMCLFERGRRPLHVPAFGSDEVADVTGAGDTVIAVFTLALLAGGSFAEAAHLANRAAGLVVMKAGTATLTPDELLAATGEEPRR